MHELPWPSGVCDSLESYPFCGTTCSLTPRNLLIRHLRIKNIDPPSYSYA